MILTESDIKSYIISCSLSDLKPNKIDSSQNTSVFISAVSHFYFNVLIKAKQTSSALFIKNSPRNVDSAFVIIALFLVYF